MSVDWDSEVIVVKRKEYDDLKRQLAEAKAVIDKWQTAFTLYDGEVLTAKKRNDEITQLKAQLDVANERTNKFRLALESLTPGGSEYFNDPDNCVAYIKDSRLNQHKVAIDFKKQLDAAKDNRKSVIAELKEEIGPNASGLNKIDLLAELFTARDELAARDRLIETSIELIKEAIATISIFHGDEAWSIYLTNAPEMKRLTQFLRDVDERKE